MKLHELFKKLKSKTPSKICAYIQSKYTKYDFEAKLDLATDKIMDALELPLILKPFKPLIRKVVRDTIKKNFEKLAQNMLKRVKKWQ